MRKEARHGTERTSFNGVGEGEREEGKVTRVDLPKAPDLASESRLRSCGTW